MFTNSDAALLTKTSWNMILKYSLNKSHIISENLYIFVEYS